MNERIKLLKHQASLWCDENIPEQFSEEINGYGQAWEDKFAELIVQEFSSLLFDESERLYAYSTECDNMRHSDEAELCAEKCIDLIAMIEQHFGVE